MHPEIIEQLLNFSDSDLSLLQGRVSRRTGSLAVRKTLKYNPLDRDWMIEAKCRNIDDPDLFHSKNPKDIKQAKAICATCPVIDRCDEYIFALDPTMQGVWAGKTHQERSRYKRAYR
jgi:WhiB family redox-sensing transcriptional regulator